MPFELIRDDITRVRADAIVNAANPSLLGGGGVDGAIHRAAGPELKEACRAIGGCKTGEAVITPGFRLPCRYVIHTVGPVYQDGRHGEKELLASCYRNALLLAEAHGCESVAFPLISAGVYGYPGEEAAQVARDTILDFLKTRDMTVFLVFYDSASFRVGRQMADGLMKSIQAYIDDAGTAPYDTERRLSGRNDIFNGLPLASQAPSYEDGAPRPASGRPIKSRQTRRYFAETVLAPDQPEEKAPYPAAPAAFRTDSAQDRAALDRYLQRQDAGFRDMLLRRIDEKGMTDAECYHCANLDRRVFNKIKNQPDYRPGKTTVLALCVGLRLTLDETRDMLDRAGYSLSSSSKADLIVEFFLRRGGSDIYTINEVLFAYDQKLLGSAAE